MWIFGTRQKHNQIIFEKKKEKKKKGEDKAHCRARTIRP